jgi:hypothetical protein
VLGRTMENLRVAANRDHSAVLLPILTSNITRHFYI